MCSEGVLERVRILWCLLANGWSSCWHGVGVTVTSVKPVPLQHAAVLLVAEAGTDGGRPQWVVGILKAGDRGGE